jgi:toxin ParE1/3/4
MKSIREIIEGNYRIIYRILNPNTIHILTGFHSKRNLAGPPLQNIKKRK